VIEKNATGNLQPQAALFLRSADFSACGIADFQSAPELGHFAGWT